MRVLRMFIFSTLFFMASCAIVRKPSLVSAPDDAVVVDTLTASVSVSLRSKAGNMSGNGLIRYRRPDCFRLVILSPFGSTVMEAYAKGEWLALLYPTQKLAFFGSFDDVPDDSAMRAWRLLRWAMDLPPPSSSASNDVVKRTSLVTGGLETVIYRSGLAISKTSSEGDQVAYTNYSLVNGAILAAELLLETANHDRIRIVFDDPEINAPLDDSAFIPEFKNIRVLPLAELPFSPATGNGSKK